jgi:integral membrane sensor domain MASE1
VAAAYRLVAVLVRWYFSSYQMWPAPLWLSAAVSMFAVFSMGRWSLPGIFLGSLLTNTVSFGEPLFWGALVSGGNMVAPLIAVELVRNKLRTEDVFSRVSDVFLFGIAAGVHGMISASVGNFAMWVRLSESLRVLPERWFYWTLSDSAVSLLLVPLFLLLRHNPVSLQRIRKHAIEFLITASVSIATVIYLLSEHTGLLAADAGASFLILLPLLWMSVRFSSSVAYRCSLR